MTSVRRKNGFWRARNDDLGSSIPPLVWSHFRAALSWTWTKQTSLKMEILDLFTKFQLYQVVQSPRLPCKGKDVFLGRNPPLSEGGGCMWPPGCQLPMYLVRLETTPIVNLKGHVYSIKSKAGQRVPLRDIRIVES